MKSTEVQYCNKTLGVFLFISSGAKLVSCICVHYSSNMKCLHVFVYYGFVQEVGTFNFFLEAFLLVLHFPFPESQFFFWVLHSLKFGLWTGLSATEWTKKIGTFHHYHTRKHSKEKRLREKKKKQARGPSLYLSWRMIFLLSTNFLVLVRRC